VNFVPFVPFVVNLSLKRGRAAAPFHFVLSQKLLFFRDLRLTCQSATGIL